MTTKIFDLSVLISGIGPSVYLSLQKVWIVFFYIRGKIMLSTVKFTETVFSVSSFHGTFEASKTENGGVAFIGSP